VSAQPPGRPLPVRDAAGRQVLWFVPLLSASGEQVLGYRLEELDGQVRRVAEFGRPQDAAAWTDPAEVARRASALGDVAGQAVLTFDGVPDRLAWAVPLAGGRTAWVTGDNAWVARARSPGPRTSGDHGRRV
jgi:hypothetical protein